MLRALVHSDGLVSYCTGLIGILIILQKDQEIVGKPAAMMQGNSVQEARAKIRDHEYVRGGDVGDEGARVGLEHPAGLGKPWAHFLPCLRPKPGSIPGSLGGRSCQSQSLGLIFLFPFLLSCALLLRDTSEKGASFTPKPALILPLQALSPQPTEVCRQALTHHSGDSQAWPFLFRLPLRFCFSVTPDASHPPELETLLPGLSARSDCSFVGEAN